MKIFGKTIVEFVSQNIYQLPTASQISIPSSDLCFLAVYNTTDIQKFDFSLIDAKTTPLERMISEGQILGLVHRNNVVLARGMIQLGGAMAIKGHRDFHRLRKDEAFLHFFRTAEVEQGNGLYPSLISFLLGVNILAGRTVLISCAERNIPSIKGITRAGGRLSMITKTVGLFGGRLAKSWAVKVEL